MVSGRAARPGRAVWLLVLAVVVGSLVASEVADRTPRTNADRVYALAGDFACPVCQGQSLGESDVPIARTIRSTIRTMVDDGRTDAEVRTMLVDRFGEDIDYTPTGRGLTGLVWVLPVLAAAAALTGVGLAVSRWRSAPAPAAASASTDGGAADATDGGAADTGRSGRARLLVGVAVVAVVAGVLVARTAGDRLAGDALTGDIRLSTRTLLAEAGVAAPAEADALYTRVLEIQPSNVEALAYRGWSRWRTADGTDDGAADRATALVDLDDAVASDDAYADVRVFRASARHAEGDQAGAALDLMVLDGLNAPPIVGDLLAASRLRQRIAGALASDGELLAALELLDSGLDAFGDVNGDSVPDSGRAALLAERGWLLASTRVPELVERGLASLDEAVAVGPTDPYALAYRAVVGMAVPDRSDQVAADVKAFAALETPPADL